MPCDFYAETARHGIYNFPQVVRLSSACEGNGFDFDGDALGQLLHGDARPSGLVREIRLVHFVHFGKVIHRGEEDRDLNRKRYG